MMPDRTDKTMLTALEPLDAGRSLGAAQPFASDQPRKPIASEQIVLFSRLGAEPLSRHVVPLAGIALAVAVIYWWGIWYRVLGPELPLFYAVAHGKNIPYLPMLQVFRGYYGITEQDNDRSVREKIAGRMLLLDESFR